MSAVDEIAAYLVYLKTEGKHIGQVIFDEMPNGEGMTATDELRRLLDERGVEWHEGVTDLSLRTNWSTKENYCAFSEWNEDVDIADTLTICHSTPEQAIEATLGKREWVCRDESGGDPCLFICSYCDAEFNHPEDEPISYCPNCGRKVVDA